MAGIHDLIRAEDMEWLERLLQTHPDASTLVNEPDGYGTIPLLMAIECPAPNGEIVRLLLKHGAQVWFDGTAPPATLKQADVIEILQGVYTELPRDFFDEPEPNFYDLKARWAHLGLGKPNEESLLSLSPKEYRADPYARPGRANPEDLTTPFRLAMIRAGCNADRARTVYGDEPDFPGCLMPWTYRHKPVWSFQRFGQTLTVLPDGRRIIIGGEHEDAYDPDFCIYNDVTVLHPDGRIQIFGYPLAVSSRPTSIPRRSRVSTSGSSADSDIPVSDRARSRSIGSTRGATRSSG